MTNFEFMEKAEAEVARLWRKLEDHFCVKYTPPTVDFLLKSRGIAGQAWRDRISFNLAYAKGNAEEMLDETAKHEVAHVWLKAIKHPSHMASWDYPGYNWTGRRGRRNIHGSAFKAIVQLLGGRGARCHSMKPDESMVHSGRKGWAYKCESCGAKFDISTVRHNRMLRGRPYWHTPCRHKGGRLVRA